MDDQHWIELDGCQRADVFSGNTHTTHCRVDKRAAMIIKSLREYADRIARGEVSDGQIMDDRRAFPVIDPDGEWSIVPIYVPVKIPGAAIVVDHTGGEMDSAAIDRQTYLDSTGKRYWKANQVDS